MPTYDYQCTECSKIVEFVRKFDEDIEPVCCNQTMIRQWGNSFGVIFNGSGFYSTDNRK